MQTPHAMDSTRSLVSGVTAKFQSPRSYSPKSRALEIEVFQFGEFAIHCFVVVT
jgi:hypothetical protein